MYLILKQLSMYQSGTSCAFISATMSGVSCFFALPLRVISMILNASDGSSPFWIKYVMMLSRVPMTSEIVQVPLWISSWALPSHTSVPCDSPEMMSKSEKFFGLDSTIISRTNFVPNSGSPNVATALPMSSGSTPMDFVEMNSSITSGSFIGRSSTFLPENFSIILYLVGTSWPSRSSFKIVSCRNLNGKCVVTMSLLGSSAGCWTGVKS